MKRLLSNVLLVVAAGVLCTGQTCAPTSSAPTEAGPSVVPGGTYSGQIAATIQVLLNGDSVRQYSATVSDFTVTFDGNGVLLIPGSSPLYVGYTHTLVVGDVTLNITVTSIATTSNGVSIGYSVVATTVYEGVPITLNGTGQIGYTVASGGALTATMTFDTTYPLMPFVTVGVHVDCLGTLTPQ